MYLTELCQKLAPTLSHISSSKTVCLPLLEIASLVTIIGTGLRKNNYCLCQSTFQFENTSFTVSLRFPSNEALYSLFKSFRGQRGDKTT